MAIQAMVARHSPPTTRDEGRQADPGLRRGWWRRSVTWLLALGLGVMAAQSSPIAWGQDGEAVAPLPGSRAVMIEAVQTSAPVGNAGLFVGVNEFTDDAGLRPLRYAVNDAIAQAHLFILELNLVAPSNAFLLLSGQPTTASAREALAALEQAGVTVEEARRSTILRRLVQVRERARRADDLIIACFSSHGFEDRDVPYVMPTDGMRNWLSDTAVNLKSVEQMLSDSQASKRLLLVDACREQPVQGGRGGDGAVTRGFREALAQASGQAVLFSADVGQLSFENPELGHGVFTFHLLRALRGHAKADERGYITLGSVIDHVSQQVPEWIVENQAGVNRSQAQRPWFKGPNEVRLMPLAIDPGIRSEIETFDRDVRQAIADLRMKIDFNGPFDAATYGRLAQALDQAENDDAGRRLLAATQDFIEGRTLPDVFVAWFNSVNAPPILTPAPQPQPRLQPQPEPVVVPAPQPRPEPATIHEAGAAALPDHGIPMDELATSVRLLVHNQAMEAVSLVVRLGDHEETLELKGRETREIRLQRLGGADLPVRITGTWQSMGEDPFVWNETFTPETRRVMVRAWITREPQRRRRILDQWLVIYHPAEVRMEMQPQ